MNRFARFVLIAFAVLAMAPAAGAAIRHEGDQLEGSFDVAQLFFTATVAPATDRFLLLAVTTGDPIQRVDTASYGGVDLVFLGEVTSPGGRCRQEWWGLVAPAEGTNPFRLTLPGSSHHVGVSLISYSGVDQRQPTSALVTASGPVGPATLTVPSAPGQVVLDGVCGWAPDSRLDMAGPNQTARWHWSTGSLSSAGSQKPGAPSVAMRWTASGNGAMEWAAAGLAVRPVAETPLPVKLAVETAGCAVGRSASGEKPGSLAAPLPILLGSLVLGALTVRATRRRPRR